MLSDSDYDRMLSVVQVVGEVTNPEAFGPVVVEQVGTVVATDVTSLNEVDPVAGRFRFVSRPESFVAPPGVEAALTELAGEHPLIRHVGETGDGSAHKISDFWTEEAWHASALYERVYQPMGVEHQMAIALPAPRPTVVGLALNRFSVDFSERDRQVLDRIRPHLAQSWRNAREHLRLRGIIDTATGALSAEGSAAVLLTEPVHELTPGALTELYRFFGRPPARTALPHRVANWLERERQLNRHAVIGSLPKPLTATRDGRRLVVRYLPAGPGHSDALLLRVSVPDQAAARLGSLGLTVRESQILTHVTSGATNAQIAAELNLAASTVKRHLDHVYRKLGVSGRVQATAVALDNLAHHHGDESAEG
jgi:DNA-binding CsgD family transcriptional regulator